MFAILIFICSMIPTLFGLYFAVISLFSLRKVSPPARRPPKVRFALVIPARNEESVIENLIHSLHCQDYPRELFEIFVVPNHCTDHTADVSRRAGARILSCRASVRSKGEVLHDAIQQLLPLDYDAFCIFDADNLADKNFLSSMNDAISAGGRVLQGLREAKNPYDSWISGGYALYFRLINRFSNRARASVGLTASINGTGFTICREVLEELGGWNTKTMAEDLEMTVQCVLSGETVRWVPQAIVYDEQPIRLLPSIRQRRRWCSGILQVARQSIGSLMACLRRQRRLAVWDCLMTVMFPFVQLAGLLPALLSVPLLFIGESAPFWLVLSAFSAIFSYMTATILALFLARAKPHYQRRIIKSVLAFGLFLISWLPIQLFSLFHQTKSWEEISHNRNLDLEQLSQI